MEHVGWLPPASGNEFIRYVNIFVKQVDIYTPVRVNDDGAITELLRDYDSFELARVRTAFDELWGGGGNRQRPISKHAQTIKQVCNGSETSTKFKAAFRRPTHRIHAQTRRATGLANTKAAMLSTTCG